MKTTPKQYQCRSWLCRAWNHWLNPFGNWIEPLPYPEKRKLQADDSWLPNALWWHLRNPVANLSNHWLGIMPVGERYQTISPEERGWTRSASGTWRKTGHLPRPYFRVDGHWTFYIGWRSSGAFGAALRRNK